MMSHPWYERRFIWLFFLILALQLFGMVLIPFSGTSEPRYAEIARMMAESGDWITPWFEPGVPFWGKPPLSFWVQALSIRLFGLDEWAVRFPSLLAFLAILAVITQWLAGMRAYEQRFGRLSFTHPVRCPT
jgi:4-amino-4-deoxy-L-arabinose transferase-like glycosyltransferase